MHGPTCIVWANLTPFSLQCEACLEELPPNPDRTRPGRLGRLSALCIFPIVNSFCMAVLHGRAGRLTAKKRRFPARAVKCDFEFCDAAPGGGDSCISVLKKDCHERQGNATRCDECVARIEHAKMADCSRQDELRFCHGEQPPSPAPPINPDGKCIKLLDADCKHHYAKQDGNLCYNCTQKALKEKPSVTCTMGEEFNFCEYGPVDHPPACIEELQKLCGKPYGKQHANRTQCTECVAGLRRPGGHGCF